MKQLVRKPHNRRKKAAEIDIGGKKYIGLQAFMELFFFGDVYQVRKEREKGLPHIKENGYYWYNIEECHAWYADVTKSRPRPVQRSGGKETKCTENITRKERKINAYM